MKSENLVIILLSAILTQGFIRYFVFLQIKSRLDELTRNNSELQNKIHQAVNNL